MLHLHFGAGRLGLGLVVPAFQSPSVESVILNRAVSSSNDTGSTALAPERRNKLLQDNPDRSYRLQIMDGAGAPSEIVRYAAFHTYQVGEIAELTRRIAQAVVGKDRGVVVTASVLKRENYKPVLEALDALAIMQETGQPIGPIYLVACENMVSAEDVLHGDDAAGAVSLAVLRRVTPVACLVDRMCVDLEEDMSGSHPTVRVRAEPYLSIKLALSPDTEGLRELCAGSQVSFSRHLAVEKSIKGWLLNGTHWLIALQAFLASRGDSAIKLNEFTRASPELRSHAIAVMDEMREGVALLLRHEPEYADFVRDVDVDDYLAGAASAILERFFSTEDPISRILARFQAPLADDTTAIEAFASRFADRINGPIAAYEAEKGVVPPAIGRGLLSLLRLVESGTFINANAH